MISNWEDLVDDLSESLIQAVEDGLNYDSTDLYNYQVRVWEFGYSPSEVARQEPRVIAGFNRQAHSFFRSRYGS